MTNDQPDFIELREAEKGLFTPERKVAALIYIFYLASLIIGVTAIFGVVGAYVYRNEGNTTVKSHYHFQIRTFWIGLLYFFIGLLLTAVAIGLLVIVFLLVWVVVRCIIGLKYLNEGKPVPNPDSWLFGS